MVDECIEIARVSIVQYNPKYLNDDELFGTVTSKVIEAYLNYDECKNDNKQAYLYLYAKYAIRKYFYLIKRGIKRNRVHVFSPSNFDEVDGIVLKTKTRKFNAQELIEECCDIKYKKLLSEFYLNKVTKYKLAQEFSTTSQTINSKLKCGLLSIKNNLKVKGYTIDDFITNEGF